MTENYINPYQVQLPTEEEDRCVICQEGLSTAQTYKLPECSHTFHTHCIVTWFRSRPSNSNGGCFDALVQGGSCPCCGNKGINNISFKKTTSRHYGFGSSNVISSRLSYLKRYSKRSDSPEKLIQLFKKYDSAKEAINEAKKNKKMIINSLKTELVNYYDIEKKRREARTKVWNAYRKVSSIELEIASFPIIPIIIPTPIDIN